MKPKAALMVLLLLGLVPPPASSAGTGEGDAVMRKEAMALDDEKSLARRSLEMWASDNTDSPEDVFAETYVNHQEPDAKGGVKSLDLAGWKEVVAENHRAFSDFQVQILIQVAEGDLVATRWRFSATHTGDYLGHPATGKRATWSGVQIDRIDKGKIVESWVDWDKYRLFEELGFLN